MKAELVMANGWYIVYVGVGGALRQRGHMAEDLSNLDGVASVPSEQLSSPHPPSSSPDTQKPIFCVALWNSPIFHDSPTFSGRFLCCFSASTTGSRETAMPGPLLGIYCSTRAPYRDEDYLSGLTSLPQTYLRTSPASYPSNP